MLVSDVVESALAVIRERGLNRGWYTAPDGSVCVIGALRLAATGATSVWQPIAPGSTEGIALGAAADAVAECAGIAEHRLVPWSDGSTQAEVEDTLERTAKDLRNRGL